MKLHNILYKIQAGEMNTDDAFDAIKAETLSKYKEFLFDKFPYASEGSPASDEINMFVRKLDEMFSQQEKD